MDKGRKLKIAVVVHGRFHSFDLARELIRMGHDVTLFTNYSRKEAERFGIPANAARSFLLHRALNRLSQFFCERCCFPDGEKFSHILFSKWALSRLEKEDWDMIYVFSGVAEEILRRYSSARILKLLARESSHIRAQARILKEEAERASMASRAPSRWMIAREEREYELADAVIVPAAFVGRSFAEEGFSSGKVTVNLSGVQLERFRPDAQAVKIRCGRISSKRPLNVLMTGTFSFRKGAIDLIRIAAMRKDRFRFRFVGAIAGETKSIMPPDGGGIEFIGKRPHFDLPSFYAWADIFIFTTIEDGYPAVLAQAQASGLPIISTVNCCAPDIVEEGVTGWLLPIRRPDLFVERLDWCDSHRDELAAMVRFTYENPKAKDWAESARSLTNICLSLKTKDEDALI